MSVHLHDNMSCMIYIVRILLLEEYRALWTKHTVWKESTTRTLLYIAQFMHFNSKFFSSVEFIALKLKSISVFPTNKH